MLLKVKASDLFSERNNELFQLLPDEVNEQYISCEDLVVVCLLQPHFKKRKAAESRTKKLAS